MQTHAGQLPAIYRLLKTEEEKLIKVLFVCLGNICRSPMAEFVFSDMLKKRSIEKDFFVSSAATSDEAAGCAVHRGTTQKLKQYGISTAGKYAVQMTKNDYDKYDYIIAMEKQNICDILKITGGDPDKKVYRLLDFTSEKRDIADPWYTGNFDKTYDDIVSGCNAFLDAVLKNSL